MNLLFLMKDLKALLHIIKPGSFGYYNLSHLKSLLHFRSEFSSKQNKVKFIFNW